MGEFIFSLCYGGALVIMGFFIKRVLKRTQIKQSSLKTHPEKEEVL